MTKTNKNPDLIKQIKKIESIEELNANTGVMRSYFGLGVFGLMILLQVGCSPQLKEIKRWSARDNKKVPEFAKDGSYKNASLVTSGAGESIQFSFQKFAGARVEGRFLQKIVDQNGELAYLSGTEVETDLPVTQAQVEKLHSQRFAIIEKVKVKNLELKNASFLFTPEVVINNDHATDRLLIHQDYLTKDGTQAKRLKVSAAGIVVSTETLGSHFFNGKGIVFPSGPLKSNLSEALLKNLLGDGTLSSQRLIVNSQASKAVSEDQIFIFDPTDVRFTQVQAYFYVDKALDWFQTYLNVAVPFRLDVETNVGAPEKSNAAFYYNGKIRLGDGDGVAYKNIPQDPSIVIHESCHALVQSLSQLPFDGEGGSLNEGFADFFTTIMLENPKLGEVAYLKAPFKRTVEVSRKVQDKNGGLYHDSGILSGTFWDIRNKIGNQKAGFLAVKTLARLGPGGNFASLRGAVVDALAKGFTAEDVNLVMPILDERGWP